MMSMQSVNLAQYPLTGVSLIEASAGTGKTYTITHLYLRYLLETDYQVNQILIVTFTNAATQELRGRIRKLIFEVSSYLQQDAEIQSDHDALFKSWQGNSEAIFKLQRALINFDEAAIFSIHGFCQRLLSMFPLETESMMQQDIVSNEKEMLQQAVRDFWRKHIVVSDQQKLQWILQNWKHPDDLQQQLQPLLGYEQTLQQLIELDDGQEQELQQLWQQLASLWENNRADISAVMLDNPNLNKRSIAAATVSALFTQLEQLFQQALPLELPQKWILITQQKLIDSLNKNKQDERLQWPFFTQAEKFLQLHEQWIRQMKLSLLAQATCFAAASLRDKKAQAQNLSFDDLIERVSAVVDKENHWLNDQITALYPVAMVDEFQDTDSQQYRIFKNLYQQDAATALIMIGDPKQAIYSFRGADVFTYQRARESTQAQFTLDTNYRSSADYVQMLNQVFSYQENAFMFPQLIRFHQASANQQKNLKLTQHQQTQPALVSWIYPYTEKPANKGHANDYFANRCADEIQQLLNDKSLMLDNEPVAAKDLAVLVKTGYQASLIKQKLAQRGIASAMIQRDSVFSSQQAMDISQLLAVLINPADTELLCGLLSTDLFCWSSAEIYRLQQQDDELVALLEAIKGHQYHWQQHGILSMFFSLIDAQQTLQKNIHFADGERRLTNWIHIMELLQQQASLHASQSQALHWLNQQIEDSNSLIENEAHQLRLESDNQLVRIVTVHKSKGLQYPIVFLPFMWNVKKLESAPTSYSYHDDQGRKKIMLEDNARLERWHQEIRAEEIRLFYVAITRAQYRCYLAWGHISDAQESAIAHILYNGDIKSENQQEFLHPFNQINQKHPCIELRLDNHVSQQKPTTFSPVATEAIVAARKFTRSIQQQWRISSYSQIASSSDHVLNIDRPDYDRVATQVNQEEIAQDIELLNRFTFYKGATAGNFIHNLLEEQVFDQAIDPALITRKLQEYGYSQHWVPILIEWMQEILATQLGPLRLAELTAQQKLCEMEFYMTSRELNHHSLNELLQRENYLLPHQSFSFTRLNGFLKGFIDLIFEYQGQYYVADYKSNYLGDEFDDYNQDNCRQAMYQHHYHLQYLIYTLALHRYLKLRLPGYRYQQHMGGVYYLFVRGMSPAHDGRGIYFDRPEERVIQQLDALFD